MGVVKDYESGFHITAQWKVLPDGFNKISLLYATYVKTIQICSFTEVSFSLVITIVLGKSIVSRPVTHTLYSTPGFRSWIQGKIKPNFAYFHAKIQPHKISTMPTNHCIITCTKIWHNTKLGFLSLNLYRYLNLIYQYSFV